VNVAIDYIQPCRKVVDLIAEWVNRRMKARTRSIAVPRDHEPALNHPLSATYSHEDSHLTMENCTKDPNDPRRELDKGEKDLSLGVEQREDAAVAVVSQVRSHANDADAA